MIVPNEALVGLYKTLTNVKFYFLYQVIQNSNERDTLLLFGTVAYYMCRQVIELRHVNKAWALKSHRLG